MSEKKRGNGTPAKPKTKTSGPVRTLTEEVRLTRRLMVGWLLAAGGATPALAQAPAAQTRAKPVLTTQKPELTKRATNPDRRRVIYSAVQEDLTEFTLLRPDDLLVLHVTLHNLVVTGPATARKIKKVGSGPALMVFGLQPQAIAERTYPDTLGQDMPKVDRNGEASGKDAGDGYKINKTSVADSYMSGPSRIACIAPSGFSAMDFHVKEVLDACSTWKLNLDARATPAPVVMPEAHAFDRIANRMAKIATAQSTGLHGLGAGAEALLTRAADLVAEAIVAAAARGDALTDATIDAMINYEVNATLGLDPESSPKYKPVQKWARPDLKATANLYVSAKAVQKIARRSDGGLVLQYVPGLEAGLGDIKILETFPHAPADDVTDLEVPFHLHMTPLATAGFSHATGTVFHDTPFAELWHTRLGTRVGEWIISNNPEPLRAIWADDESMDPKGEDWALNHKDRADMVGLMSAPKGFLGGPFTSRPAMAKHLRLTALGASLEAEGIWPDHLKGPTKSDISQWKHITSIGRDQYVRVIYEGFLFPLGHAAALIKVSERKFSQQAGGGRVAGLMQKYYIVVRQHVRDYPADNQMYKGRDFPFVSVEITTQQTPDLKAPVAISDPDMASYYPGGSNTWYQTFWPEPIVGTAEVKFHMVATDSAGRKTVFDMPLIFVAGSRNETADLANVVKYYNKSAQASRRHPSLKNALIRFSPNTDAGGAPLAEGESDYHASEIKFLSSVATGPGADGSALFYPGVEDATIEIPSVKNLLGTNKTPVVKYHQRFLQGGFDDASNPAQMVFKFAPQGVAQNASNPTDKYGGLLSPNLAPDGLSRKLGAVTNTATIEAGTFNPATALSGAKLLGFVPLGEILNQVTGIASSAAGVPQLTTVTNGESVTSTYTLKQTITTPFPKAPAQSLFVPSPSGSELSIVSTVMVAKAGQTPQSSVEAELKKFKINLFGFIILNFTSLNMTIKPGTKPDINPVLDGTNGVMFGGPLEFLNSFRDIIPMGGFADPPGLDVTPGGITASYSLALPNIGVGAMTLQNLSLGAGFDLPFTGDGPSARFNFAERHNPFNLTISLFGGGGFFAITLYTGGVKELEACLEFGAQISIDLGVASGGVYVKAGFYFRWVESPSKSVTFEGYIEMGGHLSVLGLITVSLVFHLGLTYEKTEGHTRLFGTATLTVEIDILFFSISQDVSVEREFSGSDADPAFIDFVPTESVWADYCDAFAA